PGDQKDLLASVVGQPVHAAGRIRQREVRRLERSQCRLPLSRALAQDPGVTAVAPDCGLTQMAPECGQVDPAPVHELALASQPVASSAARAGHQSASVEASAFTSCSPDSVSSVTMAMPPGTGS